MDSFVVRDIHEKELAGDVSIVSEGSSGPRVIFVDADDLFRMAMASCLRIEGFVVDEFDRYDEEVERLVAEGEIDAALLDADLQGETDELLLDRLLRADASLPVAMLAARCTNAHEEGALKRGAADYLGKSRGPTVVAKRLRLLISARDAGFIAPADDTSIEVGALTLRLGSHRALWNGEQVPLTVTEFRIVRLLAVETSGCCSHRQIYDVVHGTGFAAGDGPNGYRTNVRSLIRKIRARFRKLDSAFGEIENVAGYGYRWRTQPNQVAQSTDFETAHPDFSAPAG